MSFKLNFLLALYVLTVISMVTAYPCQPIILKEEKHSFRAPFNSTASGISRWNTYGDTVINEEYIRLTDDAQSLLGQLINTDYVDYPSWEVVLEFRIHGKGRIGADGLAFWYTDPSHTDPSDQSVFGNRNMWRGIAVFFDTFDNDGNGDNPLISVVFNDGTNFFDISKDGSNLRLGGCTSKFRNVYKNSRAKIRYFNGLLSVHIDASPSGSFEACITDIKVHLPPGYIYGFSANTRGLHDNHDIYSFDAYSILS